MVHMVPTLWYLLYGTYSTYFMVHTVPNLWYLHTCTYFLRYSLQIQGPSRRQINSTQSGRT